MIKTQRRLRIFSLLLLVVMVLGMLPVQANSNYEDETLITKDEGNIIAEVTERREKYAKHFANDDGTYTACTYPEAVHFERDGKWEEIDNTLIETTDAEIGPAFKNKNNSFDVRFSKTAKNNKLVTINKDGHEISWCLSGYGDTVANVSAIVENYDESALNLTNEEKLLTVGKVNSEVIYRSILDGIDLKYLVTSESIKEEIILNKKPIISSFVFDIKVKNLEALLNEDKTVVFYHPNRPEDVIFYTSGPDGTKVYIKYYYEPQGSYDYSYRISNSVTKWQNMPLSPFDLPKYIIRVMQTWLSIVIIMVILVGQEGHFFMNHQKELN